MAENKNINNESRSRPIGIEISIIEWMNDGFGREEDKPENDLSGIEK